MTDPVDVLARDLCCLGPCDTPDDCSRKVWIRAARAHIRALEQAGFKVTARPPPADSTVSTYWRDIREAEQKAWDAAPTYGDKT